MKILKNILILLIFFLVSSSSIQAKELNSLYLIKDKSVQEVKECVEFYTRQSNYSLFSKDNYLLMTISNNKDDYCFVSFENTADGTFFYFKNPADEKKYLKDILYRFKLRGFKYKKIHSDKILTSKNCEADIVLKNGLELPEINDVPATSANAPFSQTSEIVYDFSDAAQAEYDKNRYLPNVINSYNNQKSQIKPDDTNLAPKVNDIFQNNNDYQKYEFTQNQNFPNAQISLTSGMLPAGMEIEATIQSSINTSSLESQDMISCVIAKDVYSADKILVKQGSIIYGTVTSSKKAGSAYSNGTVTIVFNKILTTDGDEIALKSEPLVYQNKDSKRGQKITGTVLGGVLVGVASAALGGVFNNNVDWAKTLSIGAGLGAVGGAFSLLNARGQEVDLREGTLLKIKTVN